MAESGTKRSSEDDQDPTLPLKKQRSLAKKLSDKERDRTRINIGLAFPRWRALRELKGLQFDSELAFLLLDSYERGQFASTPLKTARLGVVPPALSDINEGAASDRYLRTKSESRPERLSLERSSSTETCDSVHYEYPFMMSSPNETEWETCAASSVQTSENGKESGIKDAACQRFKDQWTSSQSENKENRDNEEDKDEEFSTSLSVGDGRYLVDLGSSSEFVVDEECILQLFKSCRECSRQCTVRKHVKGLKLVVYQSCCFCQNRCKWTNLPDDDDGDFQINGKEAAHGQNNSAMSPSSNTS